MRITRKNVEPKGSSRVPGAVRKARRQSGFAMLSAVLSVMIISTTVTAGLLGVATASRVTLNTSDHTEASAVAISQIDKIREADFVTTGGQYASVTVPEGLTVTNQTETIAGGDSKIQAVTVTVSKGSEVILETTIIKVDR